jgi:hypothetical protein
MPFWEFRRARIYKYRKYDHKNVSTEMQQNRSGSICDLKWACFVYYERVSAVYIHLLQTLICCRLPRLWPVHSVQLVVDSWDIWLINDSINHCVSWALQLQWWRRSRVGGGELVQTNIRPRRSRYGSNRMRNRHCRWQNDYKVLARTIYYNKCDRDSLVRSVDLIISYNIYPTAFIKILINLK